MTISQKKHKRGVVLEKGTTKVLYYTVIHNDFP